MSLSGSVQAGAVLGQHWGAAGAVCCASGWAGYPVNVNRMEEMVAADYRWASVTRRPAFDSK